MIWWLWFEWFMIELYIIPQTKQPWLCRLIAIWTVLSVHISWEGRKTNIWLFLLTWAFLGSYSDILIEREVLMQKYIHLVQIVETEKVAANQLRHQLEDQDTEIERLKSEVWPTPTRQSLIAAFCWVHCSGIQYFWIVFSISVVFCENGRTQRS